MKLKKILSFALAAFFAAAPLAKNTAAFPAEIISEAYCVMDAETGQLLVGGSADKRMEPASITKILTCAMALEVLDPKDTYTFTKEAASYDKGSTHLAFTEGEKCRVEDMLYGAMVESANDCAMGLADAVGGSQLGFVKLMNEKAAEIGTEGNAITLSTNASEKFTLSGVALSGGTDGTKGFFEITLVDPLAEGMSFVAGDSVITVSFIKVASNDETPYVSVKMVFILPNEKEPTVLISQKARVTNGFTLASTTDSYASMPFEITPYMLLPSDNGYDRQKKCRLELYKK